MTQLSGFWTTGGSTGHQQTSYTQLHLGIASKVYGACNGFEGVASGFLNELAGIASSANIVSINTGGAIVDGRWYQNDASVDVNVPSAIGAGNTRIDRIVLRADWTNFQVTVYRIAGTDDLNPTAPAITQSPGTTYDLKLYQALVDTSGNITLTDEREWAIARVDGSTLVTSNGEIKIADGGVGETQLASGAVSETKIGSGAVTETKIGSGAVTETKIANDAVTNAKLADPYDVAILKAVDPDMTLAVEDDLINLPVPDVWNGKSVVRLWARLTGAASSSGSVTVRVYNETDALTVGTITISQGSRIGSTTTITNPTVSTDDILRVDVTGAGTGAKGLDVQIKIDKS